MRITLIMVGKTASRQYVELIDDYLGRIKHYTTFDVIVVPDVKNAKNLTPAQQKRMEARDILKHIQPGDHLVLLDEHGRQFTSTGFSQYIERKMQTSLKRIVFVIGGPYGFDDEVRDTAREAVSLSNMTFSHQMVRLIFIEQLYRAMTIMRGEPYHHE